MIAPALAERRLAVLAGLPAGMLLVHEIYASIQGESTFAGLPCTFVRLTGCPLRCRWCDTPYAFHEGRPMSVGDIVAAVERLSPRLVELTGGEPLAQPPAFELIRDIADRGYQVLLETSGAVPIEAVDPRATIIMDLKCPASGEVDANRFENLAHLKETDQIKFVIADRNDFDWAVEQVRRHSLQGREILFSPAFGEVDYAGLCEWILSSGLRARFQMQQHKHIWAPNARGV